MTDTTITPESMRAHAELADGLGQGTVARVLREGADRLESTQAAQDRDEALARALWDEKQTVVRTGDTWDSLPKIGYIRFAYYALARAARAHIAAESDHDTGECAPAGRLAAPETDNPDPEPAWTPTVGQWAQIVPGAERGDAPESVDRVLVTEIRQVDSFVRAAWIGEPDSHGDTWGVVRLSSLGPVQPRVWENAEDVPAHVVVRDRDGHHISGVTAQGEPAWGPFTEMLPEDGVL